MNQITEIYFGFGAQRGGVGKTTFQKWIFRNYEFTTILSGKSHDCKFALTQFVQEKKRGPNIVLINIPKSNKDIDYEMLENVKDMFFHCGKYEGGIVDEDPCHLFVFANRGPDTSKMTERFVIKRIDTDDDIDEDGTILAEI